MTIAMPRLWRSRPDRLQPFFSLCVGLVTHDGAPANDPMNLTIHGEPPSARKYAIYSIFVTPSRDRAKRRLSDRGRA